MRRAYTYIIVGFFFIFLSITINEIDLLHDSIGYLLIVLGVIEGASHSRIYPSQVFRDCARNLCTDPTFSI